MSYVKKTWASGDTITSAALNNIENGVEAADASSLPAVSGSDNGKLLGVENGAWDKVSAPSVEPIQLPIVIGQNEEQKVTITFSDITNDELYDLCASGRLLKLVAIEAGQESVIFTQITATRMEHDDDGQTVYYYTFYCSVDKNYQSATEGPGYPVVLTEH